MLRWLGFSGNSTNCSTWNNFAPLGVEPMPRYSVATSMPRSLTPRPQPLPLLTQAFSTALRAPLFLFGTAVCGSASLLASCFERDGSLQHRIAQFWARLSLRFAGAPLTVIGADNFRKAGVAVYTANHLSYMDTPAVFAGLPFQFRIVARHNLWSVPFIGWHLRRSGQIPVNVANPRASIASLSGGVKTLRQGMPLFIFPEGGRTATGDPQPFLNGPAFMAIRAQVPLVPMALAGTHELLPMHAKTYYPSPVTLAVGEPISTVGLTPRDVDALTAELHRQISVLFFRHSWRIAPQPGAVLV